jgi:hypothetical protein
VEFVVVMSFVLMLSGLLVVAGELLSLIQMVRRPAEGCMPGVLGPIAA